MRQPRPHQIRRRGCSWRWRRDLNPRRVAPHALSRRALSAAQTRHRGGQYRTRDASDEIRSGGAATSAAADQRPKNDPQHRGALGLEDAPADVDPMVEARVADDVEQRGHGAGLRVVRTEHEPVDPRQHQGAGAHRARLQGDHQRVPVESPLPSPLGGPAAGPAPRRGRSGPRSAPARWRRQPRPRPPGPARRRRSVRRDARPVRRPRRPRRGRAAWLRPSGYPWRRWSGSRTRPSVLQGRLGDLAELRTDVDLVGDLHQGLVGAQVEVVDDRPEVEVTQTEIGEHGEVTQRLGIVIGVG